MIKLPFQYLCVNIIVLFMDLKDIRIKRNGRVFGSITDNNYEVIRRVGLFVDLPNLYATMRDKGSFPNLDKLLVVSRSLGDLVIAKCYTTINGLKSSSDCCRRLPIRNSDMIAGLFLTDVLFHPFPFFSNPAR